MLDKSWLSIFGPTDLLVLLLLLFCRYGVLRCRSSRGRRRRRRRRLGRGDGGGREGRAPLRHIGAGQGRLGLPRPLVQEELLWDPDLQVCTYARPFQNALGVKLPFCPPRFSHKARVGGGGEIDMSPEQTTCIEMHFRASRACPGPIRISNSNEFCFDFFLSATTPVRRPPCPPRPPPGRATPPSPRATALTSGPSPRPSGTGPTSGSARCQPCSGISIKNK